MALVMKCHMPGGLLGGCASGRTGQRRPSIESVVEAVAVRAGHVTDWTPRRASVLVLTSSLPGYRQHCVTPCLLIQDTRFNPLGCNPERVRSYSYGFYVTGPNDASAQPNLHLLSEEIVPLRMDSHEHAFRIVIL